MQKVLITDDVHLLMLEGLSNAGYECDYQPNITLDQVREIVKDYHGLIINSKIIVDKTMMEKAPLLHFIARLGSGMEIVDLPYAAQRGIAVFSAPEGNRNAVAEHALGMLLSLANNLNRADREVRQYNWQREKNRGFELMGKTIGIIGFGHTGSGFAAKLAGLGMNVLAFDKYKEYYNVGFEYVTETTLLDIQQKADIISLHLPLTKDTKHLVDYQFINNCKNGVIIINTSRGNVVNTNDLIVALETGKVGGACLDVFENEKTNTFSIAEKEMYNKLYQFENVLLTPHIAGWTKESKKKIAAVLLCRILNINKEL